MTSEQTWAFYRLVPRLVAEGLIEPIDSDAAIGQAILDIAQDDGVLIDAHDFVLLSGPLSDKHD